MLPADEEVLIRHVLDSEANLEIALDVASAYDAIRHRVIETAVLALKEKLLSSPRGTELDVATSFTQRPIPGPGMFRVRLVHWPQEYEVVLQSDAADARRLYLGVNHGDAALVPVEVVQRHLNTVRSGEKTPEWGWAWWFWLDAPLTSWTTKAALLELHSGRGVETLYRDITAVIEVLDPLVRGADRG